jgi:hypothetical protein
MILATIGLAYAYAAITGDETGEKLAPIARKGPLYPLGGEAPYNISKYQNNNTTSGNYTLPKISIPTSTAAYYYNNLAALEEESSMSPGP